MLWSIQGVGEIGVNYGNFGDGQIRGQRFSIKRSAE